MLKTLFIRSGRIEKMSDMSKVGANLETEERLWRENVGAAIVAWKIALADEKRQKALGLLAHIGSKTGAKLTDIVTDGMIDEATANQIRADAKK